MTTYHVHDPAKVYEEPTPDIDQLQVTRVVFRRGVGCCDQSLVRMVTAYFDADGVLLAEVDPVIQGDPA